MASSNELLPLAIAAIISGIFALTSALLTRPVRRTARDAQRASGRAQQTADKARNTADNACTIAVTASQQATEAVRQAVPSDTMQAALLEVIRALQQELAKRDAEHRALYSKYERLYHLLVERYPDVIRGDEKEWAWPES